MVSKSKNTKRKFEVESKEEKDIQHISYKFNICRNLGLHGTLSKKSGSAWCLSPKIPNESRWSLKKRKISNIFLINLTYAEIWACIVLFLKSRV